MLCVVLLVCVFVIVSNFDVCECLCVVCMCFARVVVVVCVFNVACLHEYLHSQLFECMFTIVPIAVVLCDGAGFHLTSSRRRRACSCISEGASTCNS